MCVILNFLFCFLFAFEKNQWNYSCSLKLHITAQTMNMPLTSFKRDVGISLENILNVFKCRITCSTNMHTFAVD